MDNRRQPNNQAAKPLNRNKNFERKPESFFGQKTYQSRDGKFIKRDNRFQNRDERFQKRDERFQTRDNRNPRDKGKYVSREENGRYPAKNDRFQHKKFVPKGKNFKPWQKEREVRIVSDMQITDGKHRGKYLKSSDSQKVRPTARRLREIMFKIIFRKVRARRFLDLCAGAGTVGIEAISRGALLGTFVERSAKMCSFIRKNMETCGINEGHGEVVELECVPFLKRMMKRKRYWDVVYFDPPYGADYEEALTYFKRGAAVAPNGGVLVIEHHAEMFFPENLGPLKRRRVILQGDSALSFYERR